MIGDRWKAVEMGSEGWAVFCDHPKLAGGFMLASNLTEEHARLIATSPKLLEACRNATGTYQALKLVGADKHLPGYESCLTFLNEAIEEATA